jgi:hypothetical protein
MAKQKLYLAAIAASLKLASCALTQADEATESRPVIYSASAIGKGCPDGGRPINFNPDDRPSRYKVEFEYLNAYFGPTLNITPTENTRNCGLHLGVLIPEGYGVYVSEILGSGFVGLSPGVKADFYTTVFWFQVILSYDVSAGRV